MSLDDLDLILDKEAIISTFPAESLASEPLRVESDYLVHAKTHIPLGDTSSYVDNLFKWVSGANKGTFIGAVLGDYGEGKTSFLVHVWAQSKERRVLAVPPFQWRSFEAIVDAVASWIGYLLRETRPDLSKRVQRLREEYRENTVEALARETVAKEGGDYDTTLAALKRALDAGGVKLSAMSAGRVLDFFAEASEISVEAGYLGLLVLLDEPEKAADALGTQAIHLFLFDLADELLRRQGNYGVFVSLPRNFHASAVARFPALTARLAGRKCFPSLTDLYGAGFATDLWGRFASAFELGELVGRIVTPLALQAMDQVGAPDRKDLSYGPRTVVSAFSRMVDEWKRTRHGYTPQQFVDDALTQEINLPDGYRAKVQAALRSPDVDDHNRDAIKLLAAFPAGLGIDDLDAFGFTEVLRPLARANGPVYRTATTMALRALAPETSGPTHDPIRERIEEIDTEFAYDRRTFEHALAAFCEDLLPLVFQKREGRQLVGWDTLTPPKQVAPLLSISTLCGAFPQTAQRFPQRAAIAMVGGVGAPTKGIQVPKLPQDAGPLSYDLLLSFVLRWNREDASFPSRVRVAGNDKLTRIETYFDLTQGALSQASLAEQVGAERLTPLWVLNLLHEFKSLDLSREQDVLWQVLRADLLRKLLGAVFDSEFEAELGEQIHSAFDERPVGSGLDSLGSAANLALDQRYPEYETLVRQPNWQPRVDAYITALGSGEVPLAAKRGRDVWRPDDTVASRVLGANRMNLSGGAYAGYESLIRIDSKGRGTSLEVRFRSHPLEESIRALICSQELGPGRKFRHQGKECWFLPLEELLPVVLGKGYTLEELRKIIEIGKARGSFDVGRKGPDEILYCVPLDPDELRSQLRAKLADLVSETKEFGKLPDFASTLDAASLSAEIDLVEDDADYERLVMRINREFESLHQRLPPFFGKLQQRLQIAHNSITGLVGQLSGSRDVTQLAVPVARSPWRQALELYIVPNLQREGDDLRKEGKALLAQVDGAITRYVHNAMWFPAKNLELLLEGATVASGIEAPQSALVDRARIWLVHVSELGHWASLLRAESDPLYERILEMKRDKSHEAKADELLSEFEAISQKITDHLQLRNTTGLSAYPQFTQDLKDLDGLRQEYLSTLSSSFSLAKERVNEFIKLLNLDRRVAVVFNPAAVGGCYEQLYGDGAAIISETGWNRVVLEASEQERDITYARDILKALTNEEAASILDELGSVRVSAGELAGQTTESWLRTECEQWDKAELARYSSVMDGALATIRAARRRVGEVSRPEPPEEGDSALLYRAMPQTGSADLKALVLKMIENGGDPATALESSLGALAELFRRNAVQISVTRRSR